MQIVLVGNRVVAHGDNCFLSMGGTVICEDSGKAYPNATVAEVDAIPADLDTVGYEYRAGVFVPCAPYGVGAGALMVACEDCGTPKRSKVTADADGGLNIPGYLKGGKIGEEVSSALGLSDATVDKALMALNADIGDIKTTIRTDLGDKWLLCNGANLNGAEYPELDALMRESGAVGSYNKNIYAETDVFKIKYVNGYWIRCGYGSTSNGTISYATDINGEWTTKTLWTGGFGREIYDIAYANGYWVAVGICATSTSSGSARIAYSTSLDGTWTMKDLWSGHRYNFIKSITYANGYWVVGGQYKPSSGNAAARIAYTTSLDGTWTTKDLWNSSSSYPSFISSVDYIDGKWCAGGRWYNNSTSYARIGYATSPDGTWTTKDLWSGAGTGEEYGALYSLSRINGYWVACGIVKENNVSYARMAYATSLDGAWTSKDLWGDSTAYYSKAVNIVYANGRWVAGGAYHISNSLYCARIGYATDLAGEWATKDLWSHNSQAVSVNDVTCSDGLMIVAGKEYISSDFNACVATAYSIDGDVLLPAISTDGAYTYIKGR